MSETGHLIDARRTGSALRLALRAPLAVTAGADAVAELDAAAAAEPGDVLLVVADPDLLAAGLETLVPIRFLPPAAHLVPLTLLVRARRAVTLPAGHPMADLVVLRGVDLRLQREDDTEDRALFPARYLTVPLPGSDPGR